MVHGIHLCFIQISSSVEKKVAQEMSEHGLIISDVFVDVSFKRYGEDLNGITSVRAR